MKKKIVVAMSGGVDSSVAAALLKEEGYDVYGVTMKLSNWESKEGRTFGGCCGSKDFYDARSVAQTLGIPHYSFDYVDKFRGSVIGYFKDGYLKGETPNPCIACNKHVKFDFLLQQAVALGADYLATGHYARIDSNVVPAKTSFQPQSRSSQNDVRVETASWSERRPGRNDVLAGTSFFLRKAVDPAKDQSYVLYNLGQKELSRLVFPLGEYTKPQIRALAHKYGLKTADKPDSYEICFVPNEDYRQFISEEVPAEQRPGGPIRDRDGRVLGQHRGLPYYTIGQREGLGIAVGRPLYVTAIDTGTNTLVVGEKGDVLSRSLVVRQVTWVSGKAPVFPCAASVKIRSKHTEAPAILQAAEHGLQVMFQDAQSAVTPGQAAVFYDGDIVLGGGTIDHAFKA